MANKPKDILKVDVPEGTILKLTADQSLTDLERRALAGEDISAFIHKPKDSGEAIRQAKAKLDQEALNRITNTKPNINQPKSLKDLPLDEQRRVMGILQEMDLIPDANTAEKPAEPTVSDEDLKLPEDITAPKTDASLTESHRCPNCAWDLDKTPDKLDPADKEEWLRCLLGQKKFEKTYTLLNGRLTVKFRTRNMEENELVHEQLYKEAELGMIPKYPSSLSMAVYGARMRKLNMTVSLVNVSGMRGSLPEITSDQAKELYKVGLAENKNITATACDAIFAKWNETLFSVVFKQFTVFDDLCYRLAEAAASPDFWQEVAA